MKRIKNSPKIFAKTAPVGLPSTGLKPHVQDPIPADDDNIKISEDFTLEEDEDD